MDQIIIKTPNPKDRLFLKIDRYSDLAARVYLSEAPPLCYTLYKYISLYLLSQGRGGGATTEKVKGALVYKRGRKYQNDWLYL